MLLRLEPDSWPSLVDLSNAMCKFHEGGFAREGGEGVRTFSLGFSEPDKHWTCPCSDKICHELSTKLARFARQFLAICCLMDQGIDVSPLSNGLPLTALRVKTHVAGVEGRR